MSRWRRRWQGLKERVRYLSEGRRGLWGVSAAAFLESSVVPVPIELFLIPAFLAQRRRAMLLATAALAGCIAASAAFYAVGWLLYEAAGASIAGFLGIEGELRQFGEDIGRYGFWLVFAISLLSMPIQVATLGSGIFGYSFPMFLLAIFTSRIIRFHGLALLTLLFGRAVQRFFAGRHVLWQFAGLALTLGVLAAITWLIAAGT
ncbi:MAG: YqaA family protein [Alphaproteobacteria bacterium]